ncbi:MAG TPA: His-Xaa-Ser system protein HxsD [Thermoanaerobaculia bacterium]|nr:His-Xaa-Ser system protein HxsD [Thermoanaerobaculia bacterium]
MTLDVDLSIYPLDVVLRACHALSGRCSVALHRTAGDVVRLDFAARDVADPLDDVPRLLHDALLDFTVRATIAAETKVIRELLVAQAFCEADLLDRHLVNADEHDDPRGIAVTR